jgi:hypothetical protein
MRLQPNQAKRKTAPRILSGRRCKSSGKSVDTEGVGEMPEILVGRPCRPGWCRSVLRSAVFTAAARLRVRNGEAQTSVPADALCRSPEPAGPGDHSTVTPAGPCDAIFD